jgi:hypothetical protein
MAWDCHLGSPHALGVEVDRAYTRPPRHAPHACPGPLFGTQYFTFLQSHNPFLHSHNLCTISAEVAFLLYEQQLEPRTWSKRDAPAAVQTTPQMQ